jgi:hypothetical protein
VKEDCSVPPPIKFNCWKHHSGFIKEQISNIKDEKEMQQLSSVVLKIGESQMDLYFGEYPPEEISYQILIQLKGRGITSCKVYKDWLTGDKKEYKLLNLKDDSVWTLRFREDEGRFVHIHPGRYSPHSIRVKSLTLKTVIYVLAWQKVNSLPDYNLDLVNMVRKKFLKAPPLKSIKAGSGLHRIIQTLKN